MALRQWPSLVILLTLIPALTGQRQCIGITIWNMLKYMLGPMRCKPSVFEDGVIYHTNSPELASQYSRVFTEAGVTNFKFVIAPIKD